MARSHLELDDPKVECTEPRRCRISTAEEAVYFLALVNAFPPRHRSFLYTDCLPRLRWIVAIKSLRHPMDRNLGFPLDMKTPSPTG